MADGQATQSQAPVTPSEKAPVTEPIKAPQTDNLIQRVSQFREEEAPKTKVVGEGNFDPKDIEKIEDPKAREFAEKAYKSFESGFQKKFQEIASIRKQLEAKNEPWTTERVQSLLNDPSFVKSAQEVAGFQQGSQASDDYSNLSDAEKAQIKEVREQMNILMRQNAEMAKRQQDESLTKKYPNYNPSAIDEITADLLSGKVQATREDLFKVVDYEGAIQRAYKLGMQDASNANKEKMNLASVEGFNVSSGENAPKKTDGEHTANYFKRILVHNLTKQKPT